MCFCPYLCFSSRFSLSYPSSFIAVRRLGGSLLVGHQRNSTTRATEPSSSVGHHRVKRRWRRQLPIHSPPSLKPPPPHPLVGKRATGWVGMGKVIDVDCGEREGKKKERHSAVSDLARHRFEEEDYHVIDYESELQTAMSTTVR
uniref:Uncharacterized protein n=1 Tax=Oryza sativa subsp. japonica TaxID=39947 RepID=Q8LNM9_ORYSJ|nr:hypothetical protein [Oryza sativa Japonica Group]